MCQIMPDRGGGAPEGACTQVPRPKRRAPSDRGPPRRAPRAPIKSSNIQCRRAVPHPAAIRGGAPKRCVHAGAAAQAARAQRPRAPQGGATGPN